MSVTAASAEIALAAKDKCREIFVFPNRTNGWAARDEPRTQGGGKWLGGNFRESVIIKIWLIAICGDFRGAEIPIFG